jgi:hypothetical protein
MTLLTSQCRSEKLRLSKTTATSRRSSRTRSLLDTALGVDAATLKGVACFVMATSSLAFIYKLHGWGGGAGCLSN